MQSLISDGCGTRSFSRAITLDSSSLVIDENENRTAVAIFPPVSGQLQIRFGTTNPSVGGFTSLLPGDLPLFLPFHHYGDMIRKDFVITGDSAGEFSIVETIRQ